MIIDTLLKVILCVSMVLGTVGCSGGPIESSQENNDEEITVALGGDFYAGPRIRNKYDGTSIKKFVRGFPESVMDADFHFVNLEGPIISKGDTTTNKRYWLRNSPAVAISLLSELSVDGVSLANNHILDFGTRGLVNTVHHLNDLDVKYAGAGSTAQRAAEPVYFSQGNKTLAFLSFSNTFPRGYWASGTSYGTAYGNPSIVRNNVREASDRADKVLVSFHWGSESSTQPQIYQKNLARASVDAGADIVFGHHPHTLQPVERYAGGIIFYSLGNYFFTTMSQGVKYGLIPEITFHEQDSNPTIKYHLMQVNNYEVEYRPRLAESYERPLKMALKLNRLNFYRVPKSNINNSFLTADYLDNDEYDAGDFFEFEAPEDLYKILAFRNTNI